MGSAILKPKPGPHGLLSHKLFKTVDTNMREKLIGENAAPFGQILLTSTIAEEEGYSLLQCIRKDAIRGQDTAAFGIYIRSITSVESQHILKLLAVEETDYSYQLLCASTRFGGWPTEQVASPARLDQVGYMLRSGSGVRVFGCLYTPRALVVQALEASRKKEKIKQVELPYLRNSYCT